MGFLGTLTEYLKHYLEGASPLAFPVIFIAGVVTSFTPCTYPIIPITVAYIGARSAGSRLKGFVLSIFYATGIATTYASLGAAAALTGKLFGQIAASGWVTAAVGLAIIALSLSILDVYTLPIPTVFRSAHLPKHRHGFVGAFLVGLVSGFIMGPCTAPVLAMLLAYVASRQNVLFGIGALFSFAFGMCTLLILIGTFSGLMSSMPRSGVWLDIIKKIFAVILIVMGLFFVITGVRRMLP